MFKTALETVKRYAHSSNAPALFFKVTLCILAVLGLRGRLRAFSSCGEWGLFFVMVCGLLIELVSLVVEHRL